MAPPEIPTTRSGLTSPRAPHAIAVFDRPLPGTSSSPSNRSASRPSILLTTEGTYPFVTGGVSTWAHHLVTGLTDLDFQIYAVVANPHVTLRYHLPDNLRVVNQVPLWGTEEHAEFHPRSGWLRRKIRPIGPHLVHRFLPPFRELLASTTAAEPQLESMTEALVALADFSEHYSFKAALRHPETWRTFREFCRSHPVYRRMTAYEAVDLARLFYRYLAPLDYPSENFAGELPDVVHSSAAAFCSIPAIVLRRRHGVPFLLTEHGIYYRERLLALGRQKISSSCRIFLANLYGAIVLMAYHNADIVSPVAAYNAAWEERLGVSPDAIRPIPNGVDEKLFRIERPAGSGSEPLTIAAVARLDHLKDIHTLLWAFARVKEERPGTRLRIYGPESDPSYARSCYALADHLELEPELTFEGTTHDINGALNRSDIAVMSSISEGFPFAAVEALMAGRPMVATAVGGVSEIVREPFGALVPPLRPHELAGALISMIDRRSQLADLGELARQSTVSTYTLTAFLDGYRQLYDEVTSRAAA